MKKLLLILLLIVIVLFAGCMSVGEPKNAPPTSIPEITPTEGIPSVVPEIVAPVIVPIIIPDTTTVVGQPVVSPEVTYQPPLEIIITPETQPNVEPSPKESGLTTVPVVTTLEAIAMSNQ